MVSLRSLAVKLALLPFALAAVPPPSSDPFYKPPAGFESQPLGAILRSRPFTAANLNLNPTDTNTTQLLYRTQDVHGNAIATVTSIFVPPNAKPNKFVSFQIAEDSAFFDCSPSYNFQLNGQSPTNPIVDFEAVLLQAYVNSGYTVVAPDHEGPDACFGAGRLEAFATLDGMRAAQQWLGGKQSIVGVGYSGGAIATGWAAGLHPTYAPELDVKGWALGGTPANLTGTFVFLGKTLFSGFTIGAIDGLNKPTSYQANLDPLLKSVFTPYGQSRLDYANANCGPSDIFSFSEQTVQSTDVQTLGPAIIYRPEVIYVLGQQLMGANASETPTAPVFMYHASDDEIIPYANASTLYNSWCSKGAKVHFSTFLSGGHLTTEITGLQNAMQFTDSAFAGTAHTSCFEDTVQDPKLNPANFLFNLEPVLVQLVNLLSSLGPDDSVLIYNISTALGVNGSSVV